jgi:hypothetical protein
MMIGTMAEMVPPGGARAARRSAPWWRRRRDGPMARWRDGEADDAVLMAEPCQPTTPARGAVDDGADDGGCDTSTPGLLAGVTARTTDHRQRRVRG